MCVQRSPALSVSSLVRDQQAAELSGNAPVVLQVCRHWARTEPEAAELCQDALLVAWRRRADWDEVGSLRSWVCGIARNLGRNARRKCREVWLDPELPEPACARPDPELLVVAARESDAVAAALAELPELERRVVELRYGRDWTAGHIDETLGLGGSGARAVLQRSRRRLRRMLVDHTPAGARLAG